MGNQRALSLFSSTVLCCVARVFQFHCKFHVSRFGVRIPVKIIFCNVTPMTTQINQSIEKVIQTLRWLTVAESWEKEKNRKNCLDWDSNPKPGNVEFAVEPEHTRNTTQRCREKQGKRPMIAYWSTQCSNGCSLGSLLFPRQDNHVQKWKSLKSESKDGVYVCLFLKFREEWFLPPTECRHK